MPIDNAAKIAFLKKIHLFQGLEAHQYDILAEELDEVHVDEDGVIFEQGSKPDGFYLIYDGHVKITRAQDKKETQLATLVKHDYFGEMALVANRRRSGTAVAATPTTLLMLPRESFERIYKHVPQTKASIEVTIRSRQLARRLNFKWVRPDEVVYFLARKHRIILYENLILPGLAFLLPLGLLIAWMTVAPLLLVALIALGAFIIILAWTIWRIVDWGNDYYVVTNQRVVYLEKVVGIYESRHESPLSTIASVGVEISQLGRILDFGNVIIRTYVGKIVFEHVEHPSDAGKMIEEYWNRTKEHATVVEKEAMKNAIRKRLGLPLPKQGRGFGEPAPIQKADSPPPKPGTGMAALLRFLGSNTLKLRYEAGDTVIYRKHWVVLVIDSWVPVAGTAVAFLLFLVRLILLALSPNEAFLSIQGGAISIDTWSMAFLIALIPFASWFAYEVADWSNDKYEVTNEQIVDVDRKPFSTEVRSTASLESILSTMYERRGILGNLFNFGTVYIVVGGNKLAFEDVMDPATVQSDIDRRRMIRKAKQEEAKIASERERMAEWLATYHRSADQFKDEEKRNQK